MSTVNLTLARLRRGIQVPTDQSHRLVLYPPGIDVVEMEDVNFHHNSAVVLPWRSAEAGEHTQGQQRMSGLTVIEGALRHADAHRGHTLLLAGHTDSSGEADYNRTLSELRAAATRALLEGDRDGWGNTCAERNKVEDLQEVLAWVATAHGWDCHPGAIDDDLGDNTRRARRAFRQRHNDEFGTGLSLDAPTSAADWKAIFDLYERSLDDMLQDDLAGFRGALTFHEPAILACGEDFATGGNAPVGRRSASERRVELLFFVPDDDYPDIFAEEPPGQSIYGEPPRIPRRYIPIAPPVRLDLALEAIEGLYKPGYEAPGDAELRGAGYLPGYTSDDDRGRIFANHVPRTNYVDPWDAVRKKDTQYIELCVSVRAEHGSVPEGARIQWEWFDPDDPSHPETHGHGAQLVDVTDDRGKSRPQTNLGTCDFPKAGDTAVARFAKVDSYDFAEGSSEQSCDTAIVGGRSRVRLHVSSVAGDNFVVVARPKDAPRIAPSAECRTGVMTVWKRIDVEYVRMGGAFPLPVDEVPPYFEPCFTQMDFGKERVVESKPFLSKKDKNLEADCTLYASKAKGEFRSEGKPGWFFLASAERAAKDEAGGGSKNKKKFSYEGDATVEVVFGSDENWEKLIVDKLIVGKVPLIYVHDKAGGPFAYMGVWKKEVKGTKTHLHLSGLDYASEFEVPTGDKTGLIGNPGKGGAYDVHDFVYLRNRMRMKTNRWEPGGLGFADKVYIKARRPGAVETTGLSPATVHKGKEFFSGKLLVFTRAFDAKTLDKADALGTIVHEFAHAFGYPHKCGYYSWEDPPKKTCSMNYFSTWLYAPTTRTLQRFVYGESGVHLCTRHLSGIREVHLEDNPAMWKW